MESTLAIPVSELEAEIGLFLGFGRGEKYGDKAWSRHQRDSIESICRSGQRQFYVPPPLPGTDVSYSWSFLKPTATVTLASGAMSADLPDDFGGVEGEVTFPGAERQLASLRAVGEPAVRHAHALQPDTTGSPVMVAIAPLRGTTLKEGQRHELIFWPVADQEYTVQFCYYIMADALKGNRPYAYGGAVHAETLLESCLAIAEERLDDSRGVHAAKFMERLAASISKDRHHRSQLIGYNADRSDDIHANTPNFRGFGRITVNGVQY